MKTLKRICMIAIAVIMLMSSVVMAEDERIKFGAVTTENSDGVTTVAVEILSKPAGKSAVLVASYTHPDTGRVLSINFNVCDDVSLLTGDSLSVTLADKTEDGGVLSYDVWDDIESGISLLNSSPLYPDNLSAATDVASVGLSWNAPLDDYDASGDLTYNVYDEGMLIAENCDVTEFTAENLPANTAFNFEVCAVDTEGAESDATEISIATTAKNTAYTGSEYTQSPDGSILFTGSLNSNESGRNFYVEKTQAGGLDCYATASSNKFFTYRFADDYFEKVSSTSGIKGVAYEITYYDEGSEKVKLEFARIKADGSQTSSQVSFNKTNTNTWKKLRGVYTLPDGNYFKYNDNYGNGYYNLRINSETATVKILECSIYPLYNTAGKTDEYYTIIKKNAGSYFTADGATINCDLTCNASGLAPETVDERDGIALGSLTSGSFDFKVTDSELQSGDVSVIITYYAESEDTTISLGDTEQKVTSGGEWQKMRFDISDIGAGINSVTANGKVYINCIRVVSAD